MPCTSVLNINIARYLHSIANFLSRERAPDTLKRVVVAVNNTFLQLDDRIISDLDASRTYFSAASCDVAVFNAEFFLDFWHTVFGIQRVHLILGEADQVTRSCEIIE